MKKIYIILGFIFYFCFNILAQDITDVSKADRAYSSINNSIKKGYLSLYSDNTFRPDQPLTRKEIAIMIDLILNYVDDTQLSISQSDLSDLKKLATTFRESFLLVESDLKSLSDVTSNLDEEQKLVQYNITESQDQFKHIQKQHKYLWLGVGIAAVLGILI
jgi:hypothetical protein